MARTKAPARLNSVPPMSAALGPAYGRALYPWETVAAASSSNPSNQDSHWPQFESDQWRRSDCVSRSCRDGKGKVTQRSHFQACWAVRPRHDRPSRHEGDKEGGAAAPFAIKTGYVFRGWFDRGVNRPRRQLVPRCSELVPGAMA